MQTYSCRRPVALALLLATLTLAVVGCERRTNDPILPSTSGTSPGANNQGTVISTPPATTPSTTSPNTLPDTPASAASR